MLVLQQLGRALREEGGAAGPFNRLQAGMPCLLLHSVSETTHKGNSGSRGEKTVF
jgi:hypothetical protein